MHIPDGYLDPLTAGVTWAAMMLYGFFAYKKASLSKNLEVVVGLAASIFIAQMFTWPIPGGTSLHLVGSALAAIMLGPYAAYFALWLVLMVQAVVFHDGGITTLGANVLNMGIVAPLVGYLAYKALKGVNKLAAAFIAGWASITATGFFAGLVIGLSPSFPYGIYITVPVMTLWHAALGVVEGVITAAIVAYLLQKAPQYVVA
jgi:cobalt/nickel transport system permease protein